MGLKKILQEASLTRRSMLKSLGVAVTVASVSGCSTDDSDEFNPLSHGQTNLEFQEADRFAFNTGPFNCGSKCVHKFHVKNERIIAMTSAGDTSMDDRASDEYGSTERGKPMQFRSCVRGYSYIQRVYQPDRLKYPLKQTGEKGNISTFKRISWEEAYNTIAQKMKECFDEASTLGYVPVLDRMGFVAGAAKAKGVTYLAGRSNASNGNSEAAKLDCVGTTMVRNSKADNINSKFTVLWGCDPTRHSNHENGSYWMYTQAKEKKIDIITISPVCTDQAAMYSNSVTVDLPSFAPSSFGGGKVVIPGWVPIRPGTDGALALALCYVLYRRGLYDTTYLSTTTNRKCFGFYKDDSVTSVAPEKSGSFQFKFHKNVTGEDGNSYTADTPFSGQTFTVPTGKSFEEILVNLENGVDNGGWAKNGQTAGNVNILGDPSSGETEAKNYSEVLEYVAKLTGVKSEVIEALAYHFAKTDPSKIDAGCGPQRQYAGAEWVWLVICFTVMCGYVEKPGGGLPIGMGSFPDNWVIGTKDKRAVTGTGFIYNIPTDKTADSYINIMDQNLAEIILTGRDGRTATQFQKDNSLTVDTAKTPSIDTLDGVKIKLYTMSASNRLITHPNTNKTIEAYRHMEMVVVCDQVMTPSAAFADIVLPAATHLEDVGGIGGQGEISILKQNVLRKTMYETKRQGEITATYKRKCAEALGLDLAGYPAYSTPTDLDNTTSSKATVENYATSTLWDKAVGENVTMPTWEEYAKKGSAQVITPADKPIMGLVHHHKPGVDLETSTGYINFWSPFWGLARKEDLASMTGSNLYTDGDFSAGWRVTTANYVPVREGYEKFFAHGSVWDGFEGYPSMRKDGKLKYKLQFMTNKARNRAHTCQDNVAIIKDQFEQKVYINPIDAAERLIKDGDLVYVYNDRGCTKIRASVTSYIAPGVISVEHGAWYRAATDPKETVTVYIPTEYDDPTKVIKQEVPVDLGGCENLLTDDRFVYDPVFIHQTAGCHGGPVEVSLTKPEA